MNMLLALRRNHISVREICKVKGDYYPAYLDYNRMLKQCQDRRQQLHKQLSTLIDCDASHRIAYIYLQRMISEEKDDYHRIPKIDQLPESFLNELQQYLQFQKSVKKYYSKLDTLFGIEVDKGDQALGELYQRNWYVQNALLTTNRKMFDALKNTVSRKKKSKLWKIMMRAFAKTAPFSTYTSITLFDERSGKLLVEVNQSILMKLWDMFLLIPEVVMNSNFLIDYKLVDGKPRTNSRYRKVHESHQFYGNESFVYIVPKKLSDLFRSGDLLSSDQLIAIGKGEVTTELLQKLQVLGFIKNTLQIEYPEPTLEQLLALVATYAGQSQRVEEIRGHLEAAYAISKHLEACFDIQHKERDLDAISSHLSYCAALSDENYCSQFLDPIVENSYFNTEGTQNVIPEEFERHLKVLDALMPVFDNRIIFQHYLKQIIDEKGDIPFTELQATLHELVNKYQQLSVDQSIHTSFFSSGEVAHELLKLRNTYQQFIMGSLNGEDVYLTDALMNSIIQQFHSLPIHSTAFTKFLIQHDTSKRFIVNDIQFSYLNFFIRHGLSSQYDDLFELLERRMQSDDSAARLITYSPSYGYHPNLSAAYSKACSKFNHSKTSNFQHPSFFDQCTLCWDEQYHRFYLKYSDGNRIPLYTGQLAPTHLSEQMKVLPYIFQNGFIQGMKVHYLSITLQEYTEIGRIVYGSLVLQRRRQIVHSRLISGIKSDFQGYSKFHELLVKYGIPTQTFVRLFPVENSRLQIRYGDVGLHKPIFFDAEEPVYYSHMLRHIQVNVKKYSELAIVFEEALPNPYENHNTVEEYLYEIVGD